MPRRRHYPAPDAVKASGASPFSHENLKEEVARRINALLDAKGWNQSELSRRASVLAPKGVQIERSRIHTICSGKHLPNQVALSAIAKAFGVKTTDLIPEDKVVWDGAVTPPISMSTQPDGKTRLKIDMAVDMGTAIKVLGLLGTETT